MTGDDRQPACCGVIIHAKSHNNVYIYIYIYLYIHDYIYIYYMDLGWFGKGEDGQRVPNRYAPMSWRAFVKGGPGGHPEASEISAWRSTLRILAQTFQRFSWEGRGASYLAGLGVLSDPGMPWRHGILKRGTVVTHAEEMI
jgi:hypothetical protein